MVDDDSPLDTGLNTDKQPDVGGLEGRTPRPDGPSPDTRSPDTRSPDTRSPDTRSPDTLSPDVLPADTLSPDTMPQGTFNAPFTLDFESNNGGLKSTGDWQWGALNFSQGSGCTSGFLAPTKGHSGTNVWGTTLNDCHSPQSPSNDASGSCGATVNASIADDAILSLDVAIPSGWTMATLTYWQWHDGFLSYDWGEIRANNQVVAQFCSGTPPGSTGSWEQVSIDLSSYTGKTVKLTFHFIASSSVNHAGWYIDDLSVSGI